MNDEEYINMIVYNICSLLSYNNDFFKNNYILDEKIYIDIYKLEIFKIYDNYINIINISNEYTKIKEYSDYIKKNYNNIIKSDIILINLESINNYYKLIINNKK